MRLRPWRLTMTDGTIIALVVGAIAVGGIAIYMSNQAPAPTADQLAAQRIQNGFSGTEAAANNDAQAAASITNSLVRGAVDIFRTQREYDNNEAQRRLEQSRYTGTGGSSSTTTAPPRTP